MIALPETDRAKERVQVNCGLKRTAARSSTAAATTIRIEAQVTPLGRKETL